MTENNYEKVVKYILAYQDKFYRLAYSYLHNKDNSLDAVQNTIYQALRYYKDLRYIQRVNTWFYRILVHESLEILRKNTRETLAWDYLPEESLYNEVNNLVAKIVRATLIVRMCSSGIYPPNFL